MVSAADTALCPLLQAWLCVWYELQADCILHQEVVVHCQAAHCCFVVFDVWFCVHVCGGFDLAVATEC
jgi:hypothetical protein